MALDDLAWSFTPEYYTDAQKFNKDVIQYQVDIKEDSNHWNQNEVVVNAPVAQIQYMAWVFGPEDFLENESLIEEDKNVFEESEEDDGYQVEIIARLKADNGKYFTALEFLMKTHNQLANKELGDHVFFEGFDEEAELVDGIATYYIACGS